jgi:hypothetical protein
MVTSQEDPKAHRDMRHTCKAIHFYKYESEISLQQGRTFFVNKKGQIFEINLDMINSKKNDENLQFYIKNIETFMNVDRAVRNRMKN